MAHSGARPAKIAPIQLEDVRQSPHIWIMHITETGEGNKRVKTEGLRRAVPIRSRLVRRGLSKHFAAMKTNGAMQLFPEVKNKKNGQVASQFFWGIQPLFGDNRFENEKSAYGLLPATHFIDHARL